MCPKTIHSETEAPADKLLRDAASQLSQGEYQSPRLDAIILLCHAWNISKESLYSRMKEFVPSEVLKTFQLMIARRANGEPVAYITEQREFYGLSFYVDSRVLVPRPDSETLVEWVLENHDVKSPLRLHDCCSGSGALAIAIKNSAPTWEISASDVSTDTSQVFMKNWHRHFGNGKSVPWSQSDILDATAPEEFDLITANPPYLTSQETDNKKKSCWREPLIALDGGIDGLDLMRRLCAQSFTRLREGGWLYAEAADWQAEAVKHIFTDGGFVDIHVKKDLAGHRRITRGRKG